MAIPRTFHYLVLVLAGGDARGPGESQSQIFCIPFACRAGARRSQGGKAGLFRVHLEISWLMQ